ncbi:MAG: amidohydrolase family protein [Myxococcota bacterium]
MIDTHTHVIAADHGRYPLDPRPLSGPWYLEAPHTAEELAACMDDAGVEQAVLVQAVGAYSYDNAYAADAAQSQPARFASACCIDATADAAVDTLRHWVRDRGMHGVRLFALAREAPSWLVDSRTFPLWEEAAALGIHVIVTIFPHQLGELRDVLRRFPEVRVSLDHCGFPEASAPEPLFALAAEANLLCKVSSVVLESAGEGAEAFVTTLVGRFGAERVMWGSDFCQTHDRPYRALVSLAERCFAGLTSSERERCFVSTPRSVWPSLR